MSGIAGAFDLSGAPIPAAALAPMLDRLAHRGPDGHREIADGDTVLGHLLLATTPEHRRCAQPIVDREAGLAITCDARLDDRPALTRTLGSNAPPAGASDAELVLAAYRKWGEACVRYLLGDYAFAIRDRRADVLFCARDFIGARPFYYAVEQDRFLFASELGGVIAALGDCRPDLTRMADLLLDYESADGAITFDTRVRRLPAGHTLTVQRGGVRCTRYWSAGDVEPVAWTEASALEALRELLGASVADRTRAERPPIVALSGGIDSSVVLAAGVRLGDARALSAVDDAPDCHETRCARCVRSTLSVGGFEVTRADLAALDDSVSGRLACLDDPFSYGDTLAVLLYTRAHGAGHRVVLDGVEGDLVHSQPGDLASTLLRAGRIGAGLSLLRGDGAPWHLAGRRLVASRLPGRLLEARRDRRRRRSVARALAASPLALREAERAALLDRYAAHLRHRDRAFADPHSQHAAWLDMPFITSALERYDRAAARCGVEVRHPLLDRRLVEFSLSLPWHLKRRGGESKWLLRRVAEELPAVVRRRRDHPHLGWTFTTAWATAHWTRIRAAVAARQAAWSPYLRPDAVLQTFRPDRYNDATALPLQLHFLTEWLETHR